MPYNFPTYQAYLERYKMFWSEEGDGRPPLLSEQEFQQSFQLLRDSYQTYQDMIDQGMEDQAAHYYMNVIHFLENKLAIADGYDNFIEGRL
ncbi:hypothetical protein [Melghirimyces algeriensis]|uniref:Uncharacterized protein n=1 Tax=Melghirimyces algeriensis TaxID=910412 RepID=A0A521BTN1_9BACL|nr:hypothetical protein [Melghirimyces algeriensis]SMO50071.1 hypothetical protein SAMN06264849_102366 [Melghirimyces algeriensis]